MSKLRFCLIGDGAIAKYHRKAIEHVRGIVDFTLDPIYGGNNDIETLKFDFESYEYARLWSCDYFVIASPSHLHYPQIKYILLNSWASSQIICEKPAFLPWESAIDSDRINIVLQLRYLPDLPMKADLVKAVFVRDEKYFKSWKGDAKNTGGLFYNLFIHYIDLAIQLGADFEGMVLNEGEQERWIGENWLPDIDTNPKKIKPGFKKITNILKIDMQTCYNRLYEDVISGGGIKPKNIFYLNWVLKRNSELFGYGKNGMNRLIRIGKELL